MVDPSHVFVNPSFSLADVEENKVVQYKRMYSSINVKVLGLAMNLAGGVGPTLLRVIKRCSEIAGGRVPVWANWTAATFNLLVLGCRGWFRLFRLRMLSV